MFEKRVILTVIPALVGWTELAHAETGSPDRSLEEVVVSALRETHVQDIDASISVLDRANIEASPAQHFQELFQQVPNLNLSGEGSRARYFQLRGIGELEQYEGAPNPSVGFIIDDIDLSGVGGISALFDIQRIEVLRGPQATRFGANAIAGLIYMQSADANDETELNARLMSGNDDSRAVGFALGGAMGERLNGRFSIHQLDSNGFYDNAALGRENSNGRNELLSHGKLQWTLENGWTAKLSMLLADFDNGYDAWSPQNGRTTWSDHPGRDEQQTSGISTRISGPLSSDADFVSITAYANSDILFSYDGEWGDADFWSPYVYDYVYQDNRERKTLSQEFRILSSPNGRLFGGKTDWLVGIYAQRLDESNHILSAGIYDDSADVPYSYCAPCLDKNILNSAYASTNYALFGKLDTAISERMSLSVGLRVEHWAADYTDSFVDEIYADPNQPVRHAFSPADSLWGGNVSLNYELTDQSIIYGLVSRGYKAGGFNPSLARAQGASPVDGPAAISFDPEELWNYEAGLKGLWLDSRLSGAFSVFFMNRNNMQLRSSAQYTDNPNDFIFITSNAEGHSWGLEASVDWRLSPTWTVHGNLGVLGSEVDAYALEREADISGELSGREFAHAPPYTLNLGVSFQSAGNRPGRWVGQLDFNALGSFFFDYSHDEKAGARQIVNFKLGRQWQHWEVYGWARNLLDENYHSRGFSFGLSPPWFERTRFTRLGDPRHYGITVNYRY